MSLSPNLHKTNPDAATLSAQKKEEQGLHRTLTQEAVSLTSCPRRRTQKQHRKESWSCPQHLRFSRKEKRKGKSKRKNTNSKEGLQ